MATASLIRVASLAELHGDGPHALSANGIDVVVVRTAAGLRAFEGHCPHQGALLGEGELDGDKLVCRNHRWHFSTDSGQHEGGPECLASCPVVERERALFVDVSGLSRGPGRIVAKRTLDDLPGPRGLPFLGNIHQLDLTKIHLILERWAAQHGPVYLFRMGSKRVVALSDPEWCHQVLRARPETFSRQSRVAPVFSEMGVDGVFSAEGGTWRTQRRLANLALAQRHLRGLYPKLQTVTTRLKKRWERLADAGALLNIVEELKRFTVDVTTHHLRPRRQHRRAGKQRHSAQARARVSSIHSPAERVVSDWRLVRLPRDRRLDRALGDLRAWLGELVVDERV